MKCIIMDCVPRMALKWMSAGFPIIICLKSSIRTTKVCESCWVQNLMVPPDVVELFLSVKNNRLTAEAELAETMSQCISSDWSWWDSVCQSYLSIHASLKKLQRPGVMQLRPLLDNNKETDPRSWKKRANINILFLVYQGNNLFFLLYLYLYV